MLQYYISLLSILKFLAEITEKLKVEFKDDSHFHAKLKTCQWVGWIIDKVLKLIYE